MTVGDVPLVGSCPAEVRRPLDAVLERVVAAGAPVPPWIAVGDPTGSWLGHARRCAGDERARAVLISGDDLDLCRAVRMGIGGAAPLPPSTPALAAALRAAAVATPPLPSVDLALVDEIAADPTGSWRIGWIHQPRWRKVLGERRLARALSAVAAVLEIPPVLVPGPALLAAGAEAPPVAGAWDAVSELPFEMPGEPPSVFRVAGMPSMTGPFPTAPPRPRPVHELPSGRRLGSWWIEPAPPDPDGWLAVPGVQPRATWQLLASSSVEEIPEAATVSEVSGAGSPVVRVPAWVSEDLRPGSPSWMLVEAYAEAAERCGSVLWVPGIDPDGLVVLLRLGIPLWVDGPAVPG